MWERWHAVLSYFSQVYYALKSGNDFRKSKSHTIGVFIKEECDHGAYLSRIAAIFPRGLLRGEVKKSNSFLRYRAWQLLITGSLGATLSSEEQLLHDLARDVVVNTKAVNEINQLLNKGFLNYDNRLRIMNRSFINFVLNVVKQEEIMLLQKTVNEKERWNKAYVYHSAGYSQQNNSLDQPLGWRINSSVSTVHNIADFGKQ